MPAARTTSESNTSFIIAIVIFAIRAWMGLSPWQFIFYGVLVEILAIWALRPNIKRLFKGTERVVGWRARRMQTKEN